MHPAQVHIKFEEFEETYNAQEIKAKDQQAANLNIRNEHLICQLGKQLIKELSTSVEKEPKVLVNVPSDVRQSLDLLYKVLCIKFDPFQVNNNDDTFSFHSLGWNEDYNKEYNTLWPTPSTTPLEDDDMHPPQP